MDVREKQSSEKRLIDREALLSFEKMDAELCATCGEHHTAEDVIMMIKTAPTVDAVEVVHGRWIGVDSSYWRWSSDGGHPVEHITFRCSECARKSIIKTNYCPNCGAKMDGGAE